MPRRGGSDGAGDDRRGKLSGGRRVVLAVLVGGMVGLLLALALVLLLLRLVA